MFSFFLLYFFSFVIQAIFLPAHVYGLFHRLYPPLSKELIFHREESGVGGGRGAYCAYKALLNHFKKKRAPKVGVASRGGQDALFKQRTFV